MGSSDIDIRYAEKALDLVGAELDKRERAVVNEVMAKIAQNEAIPGDYAVQKWLEVNAIQRLRKGLEAKSRVASRQPAQGSA